MGAPLTVRAGALVALALLTGCPARKRACAPGTAPLLTLRDAGGAVIRTLKPADSRTLELCDAAHARTATVLEEGAVLTVLDGSGKRTLRVVRLPDGDLEADDAKGARLRVHFGPQETRILRPDGVAFGSIAQSADRATVFDKASAPVASVTARDGDYVLQAKDGTTRGYLTPGHSATTAAVFAIDDLTSDEQFALYRLFTRR